ncbi:MAG: hypothetical protein APR62_01505 [Smithella sp. SDB]|nr:MAG: hypothetical protein APR62_01505 [Smithella sp. SDB]
MKRQSVIKRIFWLIAMVVVMGFMVGTTFAATPTGFSSTTVTVNAQVTASCQEVQHGSFPNPLIIDPQLTGDQTFPPTSDELVRCTNGGVFTVKVSSANGSAVDQTCTSSGVNNMLLKSTSWPMDTIPYTFMCVGDTNGSGQFIGAGYAISRALGISIKVTAANAQLALAHADYSDTITLTISY